MVSLCTFPAHQESSTAPRNSLPAVNAAQTPFAGSPTITINGADVFPSDGRTSDLACRVYATPHGLKGTPTTEQITAALRDQI